MKEIARKFSFKSFIVGVLTACLVFWLATGRSTEVTASGGQQAIAAGDGGVYIMKDGYVRFVLKGECVSKSGCHFNSGGY